MKIWVKALTLLAASAGTLALLQVPAQADISLGECRGTVSTPEGRRSIELRPAEDYDASEGFGIPMRGVYSASMDEFSFRIFVMKDSIDAEILDSTTQVTSLGSQPLPRPSQYVGVGLIQPNRPDASLTCLVQDDSRKREPKQ